jgi:hypothetical protein
MASFWHMRPSDLAMDMLVWLWTEVEYCCDVCWAVSGADIVMCAGQSVGLTSNCSK